MACSPDGEGPGRVDRLADPDGPLPALVRATVEATRPVR